MEVERGLTTQQGTLKFSNGKIEVLPSLYDAVPPARLGEFETLVCKVRTEYEITVLNLKKKNPLLFNFNDIKTRVMEDVLKDFLVDTGIIKVKSRSNTRGKHGVRVLVKDNIPDRFALRTFLNEVYVDKRFYDSLTDTQQDSFMALAHTMLAEYRKEIDKSKALAPSRRSFNREKANIRTRFFFPWCEEMGITDGDLAHRISSITESSIRLCITDDVQDCVGLTTKKYYPVKVKLSVWEQIPSTKQEEFKSKISEVLALYKELLAKRKPTEKSSLRCKKQVFESILLPYLDSLNVKYDYRYSASGKKPRSAFSEFISFKNKTSLGKDPKTKLPNVQKRVGDFELDKIISNDCAEVQEVLTDMLVDKTPVMVASPEAVSIPKDTAPKISQATVAGLGAMAKAIKAPTTKQKYSFDIENEMAMAKIMSEAETIIVKEDDEFAPTVPSTDTAISEILAGWSDGGIDFSK